MLPVVDNGYGKRRGPKKSLNKTRRSPKRRGKSPHRGNGTADKSVLHSVWDNPDLAKPVMKQVRQKTIKQTKIPGFLQDASDYETWLDSYTQNASSFRSTEIYYETMREELLKIADAAERSNNLPNRFCTALACDLQYNLSQSQRFGTKEDRMKQSLLNMELFRSIYAEDDISAAIKEGPRGFLKLTPYFEVSQELQAKVDELQEERKGYEEEFEKIKLMNERTERVLNKGMKNWQGMLVRQVFDHWRYKLRLSKVHRTFKNKLGLHMKKIWNLVDKREIFEKWVHLTRENQYNRTHKSLMELEVNVRKKEAEKEELSNTLQKMMDSVRTYKSRRTELEKKNQELKAELTGLYQEEMKLNGLEVQTSGQAADGAADGAADIGHMDVQGMRELIAFTRISLEVVKTLQVQYKLSEDIDEMYRGISRWLKSAADDNRDVFCFYAMSKGGARTMSEDEFGRLLLDSKVVRGSFSKASVQQVFRAVTIENEQFVEGHCELVPQTYIEALLRVACEKFCPATAMAGTDGSSTPTLLSCVCRLCEDFIFPHAQRHDADMFRQKVFGNPRMREMVWVNRKKLQRIFWYYAKIVDKEDEAPSTMDLEEFMKLVEDCNLSGFGFTQSIVADIFMSIQHRPDEDADDVSAAQLEHSADLQVTFEEFIEGLVACACYRNPNPYEPLDMKFKSFIVNILKHAKKVNKADVGEVEILQMFAPESTGVT